VTINRQWLLAERPSGMVGPHNFEYAETPIPEPKNDEVLVKNLFLSFDPCTTKLDGRSKSLLTTRGHRRSHAGWLCWAGR
jgi:NADPH-dependent curcumin reductase CurA